MSRRKKWVNWHRCKYLKIRRCWQIRKYSSYHLGIKSFKGWRRYSYHQSVDRVFITLRRYSRFIHEYTKSSSPIWKKNKSEDDLKPLHLLEEDIPANKEEFNKAQTCYIMTHEEANQETRENLERKSSTRGPSLSWQMD